MPKRAPENRRTLQDNDAHYRAIARNFPGGTVAIFDHDLRYVLAEGESLEALGLSKELTEGRTIFEVLAPDVAAKVEPYYRAVLKGERNTSETKVDDRWFFVHRAPLFSEDGQVEAGMLVALDITDRKRAEEAEAASLAFLDSIVDNLPSMVFVKDAADLRFVRINRAGEELLGLHRSALLGYNDHDFFPKEQARAFIAKDREVLRGTEIVDIPEEEIETANGRRILHTRKIPILGDDGEPRYLLGISEDITEQKEIQLALEQARAEADRANRTKDEFLSRMSHELRTPMNAVLGFAQILQMDELTPDQRESVNQILRGGRHLLGLIDEVLDISRIASGSLTLSTEPVSVEEVVTETIGLIRPLAAERDVTIRTDVEGSWHVLADRQRLRQVLLNLLSNAVKYNRHAGTVTVETTERSDRTVRIRVSDSGQGIEPHVLERVFVPFDRLGAEAGDIEGTGLGLALTKGLVEAMGGQIGVESVAGEGAAFWFDLPHSAGLDMSVVSSDAVPAMEEGQTGTLLYIEDNPSNVQLITRILEGRSQLRLLTALHGSMGVDLARSHRPDAILLDLHLPDLSGEDILRRLQTDPETADIPVIVISANAMDGIARRLMTLGASGFVTKPLDVEIFLSTLDRVLRNKIEPRLDVRPKPS